MRAVHVCARRPAAATRSTTSWPITPPSAPPLRGHGVGSTSVTLDASGNKIGEMKYTPYGETRYIWGGTPTDRRFTGQRQEDSGLGSLYDFQARFYSPVLGRFLSADTLVPSASDPQQLNRYAYARGNPVRYTDPTGHYLVEGDEPDPTTSHLPVGSRLGQTTESRNLLLGPTEANAIYGVSVSMRISAERRHRDKYGFPDIDPQGRQYRSYRMKVGQIRSLNEVIKGQQSNYYNIGVEWGKDMMLSRFGLQGAHWLVPILSKAVNAVSVFSGLQNVIRDDAQSMTEYSRWLESNPLAYADKNHLDDDAMINFNLTQDGMGLRVDCGGCDKSFGGSRPRIYHPSFTLMHWQMATLFHEQ